MAVRIRRAKAHRDLLERLCEGAGNPFNHYYEALVFCAALGFARGAREPVTDSDEPIRWEQFVGIDGAQELVSMLAAATVDDADILSDASEERCYEIFEEYANGGLSIIAKAIEASPAKMTRDVVLDLVLDEEEPDVSELDFDSIAKDLN
jgi:dnd system-associated protein 4